MPSVRDIANAVLGTTDEGPGDISLDLPEVSSDTYQLIIFCLLLGKLILVVFLLWLRKKNASLTARLKWK
ncbi:putative P6 protein [Strawberry virus 1]|uniref:Putative P6 protein n=1 Tax=Cytorhabdovirus fragariae TaxID=2676436 RepID=A0A650ACR0_9RHAB|nr:putative P6 protein [Cytorhabdovirus fragariae]QGA73163.1 putative P6 protein [Strawberry virus 1]QGN65761.1 putative P6 protein [Cytorhabdovirus fragariae]UUH54297.1 putative P6 protein [Cytorhabdovirus fragariae]